MTALVRSLAWAAGLLCFAVAPANAQEAEGDPFAKTPTHKAPQEAAVRQKVFDWLVERGISAETMQTAQAAWPAADPPATQTLLERLVAIAAHGDMRIAALVELCSRPKTQALLPSQDWIGGSPEIPSWLAANLRLYFARWLVQEELHEEAAEQLAGIDAAETVDPAGLFFHQAVVHHRLLDREAGLAAIASLIDDVADGPRRYVLLAGLMKADLDGLEDESLDHVSRRMRDVGRRLTLGRAGIKVRTIEDGIVDSLDKMIEELEQQQNQSSGGSGNIQSSSPAQDSLPLGGKGPGNVANREFEDTGNWGDLPPKKREEVLQQIGKDFPPHYREMIEQYFRRMATSKPE